MTRRIEIVNKGTRRLEEVIMQVSQITALFGDNTIQTAPTLYSQLATTIENSRKEHTVHPRLMPPCNTPTISMCIHSTVQHSYTEEETAGTT